LKVARSGLRQHCLGAEGDSFIKAWSSKGGAGGKIGWVLSRGILLEGPQTVSAMMPEGLEYGWEGRREERFGVAR